MGRSTMKLVAGFATLAVALPVAAAFGWNVGGGEKEVSLKVCRPFELGTETFCFDSIDYQVYDLDRSQQKRATRSAEKLWTSWKKDNPAPSVKCEAAMKRYLCRDALPGCSEVSAESSKDVCRIKAFPCKSVCTATVPVCTTSGNAKDEKGGWGWLKCDTTPTGQTFEPGCCGNATVKAETGGAPLPSPMTCKGKPNTECGSASAGSWLVPNSSLMTLWLAFVTVMMALHQSNFN